MRGRVCDVVLLICAAAVNHREAGYTEQVVALTGGKGPELILEMAAHINLARDLEVSAPSTAQHSHTQIVAPFGTTAIIGSRGAIEIIPRHLMARNATVFGLMASACPPRTRTLTHNSGVCVPAGARRDVGCRQCWRDASTRRTAVTRAGLENGTLKPVVGRSYPLDQVALAHTEVIEHAGGSAGKIVLAPWA